MKRISETLLIVDNELHGIPGRPFINIIKVPRINIMNTIVGAYFAFCNNREIPLTTVPCEELVINYCMAKINKRYHLASCQYISINEVRLFVKDVVSGILDIQPRLGVWLNDTPVELRQTKVLGANRYILAFKTYVRK